MGWHPDLVRQTSLSDFSAAFEGYLLANGVKDDGLSDDEIDELQELIVESERTYPQGRGALRQVKGADNGRRSSRP